jgi:hypothetical protein
MLMRFTRAMLDGHADFDASGLAFTLNSIPAVPPDANSAILLGRYELPRRNEEAQLYRLQHPLAQSLLKLAQTAKLEPATLHLDYDAYGSRISVLEGLRGKSGMAAIQMLTVQSLGATEEYLLAVGTAEGKLLEADVVERLLALPGFAEVIEREPNAIQTQQRFAEVPTQEQAGLDFNVIRIVLPKEVEEELRRQRARLVADIEQRNLGFFSQESDKVDAWADDLKVGLEREIKEVDRAIKECRAKGKSAATLAEKLEHQKEQRSLEALRDKKRRELFNRQDEIQQRRDELIEELEGKLKQQVYSGILFAANWSLR